MNKRQILRELAVLDARYTVAKEALASFNQQYTFIKDKILEYIQGD